MQNKIEIITETEEFIVVNKPPSLSVTADRSTDLNLLSVLAKQMKNKYDLKLINRLDKFISGAMILAKNHEAQSKYASLFAKNSIKKTYLAIVNGFTSKTSGLIDTPIARCKKNPRLMRIDRKRGKPALTSWRLLADFGTISLLAAQPATDRTHQLRLHLRNISLPLAIDPLYGSDKPIMLSDFKQGYTLKKGREETPLIDRLTLHVYQLDIPSDDGTTAEFVAKPDKKFAAAIKMLTKHNPAGQDAFTDPENFKKIISAQPI